MTNNMDNTTQTYEEQLAQYRLLRADAQKRKEEYIEKLPQRKLDIARLYYQEHLTLAKIGERYGITRARVHQILNDL